MPGGVPRCPAVVKLQLHSGHFLGPTFMPQPGSVYPVPRHCRGTIIFRYLRVLRGVF